MAVIKPITIALPGLLLSATLLLKAPLVLAQVQSMPEREQKNITWYCLHAPFPMPLVAAPSIPERSFPISDYGAIGDGQFLNTAAFEKAIETCAAAGGGQVIVPAGSWLTGPIRLQSHIDFHLEQGAMIVFTRDHSLYPLLKNAVTPPLYGRDLEYIAIAGEGIIDGAGDSWRPVKKEKVTATQWKNLLLTNCQRILLKGVTLRNSPKFVFYPNHCSDLLLDHVTIFNEWWAQNGDGIDISACKKVVVYKCTVSAGDDAICMKSSGGGERGSEGTTVAKGRTDSTEPNGKAGEGASDAALQNVIIAGCTVYHAHGGFVIGSNTDGRIHNIAVSDCNFIGTDVRLRFKSNMGRGGLVDNIYIQDIFMKDIVNEAILFDTYYEDAPAGSVKDPNEPKPTDKTPEFRDFHISRVYCNGARTAIAITGLPQMPVNRITFDTLVISAVRGLVATQARGIECNNVKLVTTQQPAFQADNTADVRVR